LESCSKRVGSLEEEWKVGGRKEEVRRGGSGKER
jgi:hypothetical protein